MLRTEELASALGLQLTGAFRLGLPRVLELTQHMEGRVHEIDFLRGF